jgi:hypothetical protein
MGALRWLPIVLMLAACQTTGGSFCAVSKPIRLSGDIVAKLSDAEVAQVLAHNKKGEKLCRWKP